MDEREAWMALNLAGPAGIRQRHELFGNVPAILSLTGRRVEKGADK